MMMSTYKIISLLSLLLAVSYFMPEAHAANKKIKNFILVADTSVEGLKGKQACAYIQKKIKKGDSFKNKGKPKWGAGIIKKNGAVKALNGEKAEKLDKLCKKEKVGQKPVVIDTSLLATSKIIFAAHNSQDEDSDLALFIIDPDGNNFRTLSTSGEVGAPDIESTSSDSWKFAFGENGITIFDSQTKLMTTINDIAGATRADFDANAQFITFQGGINKDTGMGINIWKSSVDGSNVIQLTDVGDNANAEWPYFSPAGDGILYFQSTEGLNPKHFMGNDGSNDSELPSPGGDTISHASFNSDGSEFVDPQTLTSYRVDDGALGQLNDLKNTTTLMTQLAELGLEEVPTSVIPGQGNRGTFALSADWSRDGTKLVFDALVRDADTDEIQGIAIFVYTIADETLTLVFGPEPFNGSRTNNHNYSVYTPKWVP